MKRRTLHRPARSGTIRSGARDRRNLRLLIVGGLLGVLAGCTAAKRMPAADGRVIEVRSSDHSLPAGSPAIGSTLQLYWFGSGCHLLRLDDLSVLTDPFVSNGHLLTDLASDPAKVRATFGRISPPDAIVVNHSHFDHLLDARPAMRLDGWEKVPLFGGKTTRHLLAGWQEPGLTRRCHPIDDRGGLVTREPTGLTIRAFPSRHAPHLGCGHTFLDGTLDEDRRTPPSGILDYPAGEVFNFLIELRRNGRTFTVFYLAAPAELARFPGSLPSSPHPVDVAIVSTPGGDKIDGFPSDHLRILQPRHVVLDHFNTFVCDDPDTRLSLLGRDIGAPERMLRKVQDCLASSPDFAARFEKIHVPPLTRVEKSGEARNVILVR